MFSFLEIKRMEDCLNIGNGNLLWKDMSVQFEIMSVDVRCDPLQFEYKIQTFQQLANINSNNLGPRK